MFDNWRYRFGEVMERLVNEYVDEFDNLRTSTSFGYLIKSCGFYLLPGILAYHEIFGYRTFTTQMLAILALVQLPLVIVSAMRLYWGMIYYVSTFRSKQKQLSDYQ